jgi:small subunit ribosomal protein S8
MDTIGDLLTRIRNALLVRKKYVDIPLSKQKLHILEILKQSGFIGNILHSSERRLIRVYLKYGRERKPVIHTLKRVSRPGLRKYVNHKDIPNVKNGLGIAVMSTTAGIVDGETARSKKLGGELICTIS